MNKSEIWQYAQIVGSIFGSGFVAAVVGYYTALRRTDREFKQKKLEELWRNFEMHMNEMQKGFATIYFRIASGQVGEVEERELTHFYSELTLITTIYFERLLPYLAKVESAKNRNTDLILKFGRGEISAQEVVIAGQPLMSDLIRETERFKNQVVVTARDVRDENLFSPITRGIRSSWNAIINGFN